jgi:hypothetical protein
VLLDESNNLKLADFGLCSLYGEERLLRTACGSPLYSAPEVIAGERYRPLWADLWSAGVVLFYMVCGRTPFEGNDAEGLRENINSRVLQIPEGKSNAFKQIIAMILEPNPALRISIKDIKNNDWVKSVTQNIEKGRVKGYDFVQVDENAVIEMAEFNIDFQEAVTQIVENKHNSVTASYYLMRKKLRRLGKVGGKVGRKVEQKKNEMENVVLRFMEKRGMNIEEKEEIGRKSKHKRTFSDDAYDEKKKNENKKLLLTVHIPVIDRYLPQLTSLSTDFCSKTFETGKDKQIRRARLAKNFKLRPFTLKK